MNALLTTFHRYRTGLERRLIQPTAEVFWKQSQTLVLEQAHAIIRANLEARRPFCVARIGGVEQSILLWGRKISKIGRFGLRLPMWYADTKAGATNAGIRPRSRESYRTFANLAFDSLQQVDLLVKFNTPLEYAFLHQTGLRPAICWVEDLSPTMTNDNHWVESLNGKRVLVISPFKTSIEKQLSQMTRIWQARPWTWQADFRVQKFPYLIDEDCPQTWQEVYQEMLAVVKAADYDVALFGCGGLGLPLAAAAKTAGRMGIHLGGHLQLLFGIYGQRHLEQEWHARWINEAWIRPMPEEVAKTAKRVEAGCYW
jgi:hypothetical protein